MIISLIILNISLIAFVCAILFKGKKKIFHLISIIGFIILFIDLQFNLLSNILIDNVNNHTEILDYVFYGNTLTSLITVFLLFRDWLKTNFPSQYNIKGSKSSAEILGINKNDLNITGGLILIAVLLIYVYHNNFKDKFVIESKITTSKSNTIDVPQNLSNLKKDSIQTKLNNNDDPEVIASSGEIFWEIKKELVVGGNGEPLNSLITSIIVGLESYSGEGSRITKAEFLTLFDRPESRLVYKDRLIRYATPKSLDIQKQEHQDYTKIFMQEKRQLAGIEFIKNNNDLLSRAESEYGILKKDMVSLLMWESGLGEFTGDYQIFNVLMAQVLFIEEAQAYSVKEMISKGEQNPLADPKRKVAEEKRLGRRKQDASKNIISLLRECKASGLDPLLQKGSWGGAIGYVQFMPYNLKYAVDADKNGVKDLFSWQDAVMSAANYLKNVGDYNSTESGRKRALKRYNPSDSYVSGVILYADTIWERYLNGK